MNVSLVIVSKDEERLADTLDAVHGFIPDVLDEVVVVDASCRRLDTIRTDHPWGTWYDYTPPATAGVTIAHQRNFGVVHARGDVIVFTDSGCIPRPYWLSRLLTPILEEGEQATCGPAVSLGRTVYSGPHWWGNTNARYVPAAPTINLAFRREVFDAVGGFDQSFAFGSDIDFTWRLNDHGYRLSWVRDAIVEHEWGDAQRQMKRSFAYGHGWAHLLRKHPHRLKGTLRDNPVVVIYPLFLLAAPITIKYRAYPLLLLIPLWRARSEDTPLLVLVDHVIQGAGVLAGVVRSSR
jgi:hypothetical protein